jgi:hypothetical protein
MRERGARRCFFGHCNCLRRSCFKVAQRLAAHNAVHTAVIAGFML